jgi:membrane-associated protease RseP (regulator of RpoE activity)
VLKRITIMFGGPLMNLLLGTVLMVVALTGIGVVQRSMTVAEVSECVPATTASNLACGPNDPISPALAAGVKPGDKIIAIGGVSVTNWNLLLEDLSPGVAAELTVLRDDQEIKLSITPVEALRPDVDPKSGSVIVDSEGKPVLVPKPVLGVILASERQPVPLTASLEASASGVAQVGAMILTLPQQLTDVAVSTFTGETRNPNGAVSVVGIGQIAGEVASSESASLIDKASTGLLIIASLNFALFAFNMLPLLPLDGGHIAGGIYESIKRGAYRVLKKPDPGPADTALLMPATWAVFILLIGMSLLLITADFINPITF